MGQTRTLVVVPHTHWDREWYRPFQEFRALLVDTVDQILDLMDADPDYARFTLDGQTVVLEDYLEIRPERRAQLAQLIRSGRILIGPWYVLPDEFLVSGEAIVRNLLRGDRLAAEFGAKMSIGYLPDQFGHIAQMPQILRGAGLDTAVLWRGVPTAVKQAEFEWQAPDGSQVFCIYLPHGYGNAARLPLGLNELVDRLLRIVRDLEPFQATSIYLLMNGSDHLPAQPGLPQALQRAATELGVEIRVGALPDYIAAVRPQVAALPRHVGELRSPARAPMLVGCTSSRIGQKQRNHRLETLLTHYAEPYAAWAGALAGHSRPHGFLREAWQLLLQNQPHDSICGCSVDQVHREMETRYDWAEQIARGEIAACRERLAEAVDTRSLGDRSGLIVWNPLAWGRTEVVSVTLPGDQGGQRLTLIDPAGHRIPVQTAHADGRSRARAAATTTLIFRAADLPPHGWALFRLEEAAGDSPQEGVLEVSPDGLENDFYRITVNQDGSLAVLDKETGVTYPAVNRFVDGGDRGDEYTYCPPERDELISEAQPPRRLGVLAGKLQGRVVEAGPVRAALELTLEYRVPAALAPDRTARSKDAVIIPIVTRVSLARGLKRIDFSTTVENTARDHRLRVHFATPYRVAGMTVETPFGVVHRDSDRAAGDDWPELPAGAGPAKTFASISDGQSGLTVINRGLPEHELLSDDSGAAIAVTLIRAVGWLSREDLRTRPGGHAGPGLETPDAQCQGAYTFEYALVTHRGNWEAAQVWRDAHGFNQPVEVQSAVAHAGQLPSSGSFLALSGDGIALAAVKPAEDGDGVIVRVYNTTPRPATGALTFFRPLSAATKVDLLERPLGDAPLSGDNGIALTLPPWRIASYRVRF